MIIFYQVNIKLIQILEFQQKIYLNEEVKNIAICGEKVDNSQQKI